MSSHLNISMETVSCRINHIEKEDIWKYGYNQCTPVTARIYNYFTSRTAGDKVLQSLERKWVWEDLLLAIT